MRMQHASPDHGHMQGREQVSKRLTFFVVTVECNGQASTHWVYARSEAAAKSEAREREFQAWSGYHVVTVKSVMQA